MKRMCTTWKFKDLRNPNDFKVLRPVLGETSEKKLRYTSYNLTGEHKKFCQNRDSQARRNFGIPRFIEAWLIIAVRYRRGNPAGRSRKASGCPRKVRRLSVSRLWIWCELILRLVCGWWTGCYNIAGNNPAKYCVKDDIPSGGANSRYLARHVLVA